MSHTNQRSSSDKTISWAEDDDETSNDAKKPFPWLSCITGCIIGVLMVGIILAVLITFLLASKSAKTNSPPTSSGSKSSTSSISTSSTSITSTPGATTTGATTTSMTTTGATTTGFTTAGATTTSMTTIGATTTGATTTGVTTTGATTTGATTTGVTTTGATTTSVTTTGATTTGVTTTTIASSSASTPVSTTPGSCGIPTFVGSNSTIFSKISGLSSYTCESFEWVSLTTGVVTLAFQFRDDAAQWFLDDVSVSNGTTEMLVNGGFELGAFSPGWIISIPNGNCTGSTPGAQVISSSVHSGSYCVGDKCKSVADQISQSFVVTTGQSYFISFWMKAGGTGPTVTASVTIS